jgi:hypothetical protein
MLAALLDLKTSLNSLGILLTLVGVYVVYINSPINESVVGGGGADTDFNEIERLTTQKNKRMKVGVFVVLAGSVLQLISNYLPSGSQSC